MPLISDPGSGKELCAWSGPADTVVIEFQHWVEHKTAHAARVAS